MSCLPYVWNTELSHPFGNSAVGVHADLQSSVILRLPRFLPFGAFSHKASIGQQRRNLLPTIEHRRFAFAALPFATDREEQPFLPKIHQPARTDSQNHTGFCSRQTGG